MWWARMDGTYNLRFRLDLRCQQPLLLAVSAWNGRGRNDHYRGDYDNWRDYDNWWDYGNFHLLGSY